MRLLLLSLFFYLILLPLSAQTAAGIINELNAVNSAIAARPCTNGSTAIISNRAMNVFLADKTGYVSAPADLSLYTNYVTFNTTDGRLTVNHNFQKATGVDKPVKKLFSAGMYANVVSSFTTNHSGNRVANELGLMLSYKWLGKVKTHITACTITQQGNTEKQTMDALRQGITRLLVVEINEKDAAFKMALAAIKVTELPGQNPDSAANIMRQDFYKDLKEVYTQKFAVLQAEKLTQTNNFKIITTSWTSLTASIPLAYPAYQVAQTLTAQLQKKHSYPLQVMLAHTRFFESSKAGRLFISGTAGSLFNSSTLNYGLTEVSYTDYKSLGGTDTLHLARLKTKGAFIGNYQTFITPSIRARVVYFPRNSHIGISVLVQQNFGIDNLLSGKLAVPVVLINSKKLPAANFEFYVSFLDISNRISGERIGDKAIVGVSVGIPFSRLIY